MAECPCSSVILAGRYAVSRRLVTLLGSLCEETILVADDPLHHLDFDGLIVADARGRHHPFSAIYAGLLAAIHPHALVVGGRRPDLKPELLQYLLDAVEPRWDLVIPETKHGLEPRLAIFSKRCLKPMAQHLDRASFNPSALFEKMNKLVIPEAELQALDPDWDSMGKITATED